MTATLLYCAEFANACEDRFGELVLGSDKTETVQAVVAKSNDQFVLIGSQVVEETKQRGFVWSIDACGVLIQKLTFSPLGGSNFLTGINLSDGGTLVGGSIYNHEDDAKSDAVLMRLNANGTRSWIKTFEAEQNITFTNLIERGSGVTAVVQPVEREQDGDGAQPLKPDEERPIFLDLSPNGQIVGEFVPLSEEKVKLFHLSHNGSGETLYASGRFSYFGQPTRPGIWEINRQTGDVRRLYSGDSIGLSFGSHSLSPNDQLSFLWRSKLSDKGTNAPISLTRLSEGAPQEIWALSGSAAATLPAAQLRLSNGDLALVLQSYPEAKKPTALTILRLSATGALLWQKDLSRPHDSAITSIVELTGGDLLLAGRSTSKDQTNGDAWLMALGAEGAQSDTTRRVKW